MIQLVLGRSGSAKTEYVFDQIAQAAAAGREVVLIVPEQCSFVSECRLLEKLGEGLMGRVSCQSFRSLLYEVQRCYGGRTPHALSRGAKAVCMKKAIDASAPQLQLYRKNTSGNAFVSSMIAAYDEFKNAGIGAQALLDVREQVSKNSLKAKLFDLSSVMQAYDEMVESTYFDYAYELDQLYRLLCKYDYFAGKSVFVDGFLTFGDLEYKILFSILMQAQNVQVTFACDTDTQNAEYLALPLDTLRRVRTFLKDSGQKHSEIVLPHNKRSQNEEMAALEREFVRFSPQPFAGDVQHMHLFAAASIYEECDHVAMQIHKLLRTGVCAAKDIAVITRNMDMYGAPMRSAFDKFDVPYFRDERHSIFVQPLIVFVDYLFRMIRCSFRMDDVLSFAKSGIPDLSTNEIALLENYAIVWRVRGRQWFDDFTNPPDGLNAKLDERQAKKLEKINEIRRRLILPVLKFRKDCKEAAGAQICERLYAFLLDSDARTSLKKRAAYFAKNGMSALAQEQDAVWKLMMQILSELHTVLGDTPMSLRTFYEYYSVMVQNTDLGALPEGIGNVQFGQADRIRPDRVKAVFVVGLNEGEFPKNGGADSLITPSERRLMEKPFRQLGKEMPGSDAFLLAYERIHAYMAFTCASEQAFFSYSAQLQGSKSEPGIFVHRLQKIFPALKAVRRTGQESEQLSLAETKSAAFELMCAGWDRDTTLEATLKAYFKKDAAYKGAYAGVALQNGMQPISIQDTSLSRALFGNEMRLSPSRIEEFYTCPFRYFCRFGVQAYPLRSAELDPMQTGTIVHYILENILKENTKTQFLAYDDRQLAEQAYSLICRYVQENISVDEAYSKKLNYDIERLKWMAADVLARLQQEFAQSDFEPFGFEVRVAPDGAVQAPVFPTEYGHVLLNGTVDRVDRYVGEQGVYLRVVDYKTGSKKFMLSDLLGGLNLQMFIYLFALCEDREYSGGAKPAGVLYMPSGGGMEYVSRGDMEKLQAKKDKRFQMMGLVLDDAGVLYAMEKDPGAHFLPVKQLRGGGLGGNLASAKQFALLKDKIGSLVSQMGNGLCSGNIAQQPALHTSGSRLPCEYCDYVSVCANRRRIEPREILDADNAKVFEMLQKEAHHDELDTATK